MADPIKPEAPDETPVTFHRTAAFRYYFDGGDGPTWTCKRHGFPKASDGEAGLCPSCVMYAGGSLLHAPEGASLATLRAKVAEEEAEGDRLNTLTGEQAERISHLERRVEAKDREIERLRETAKALAEGIDRVAPYVTATLAPGNTIKSERRPEWVEVHGGRASSSRRQLETLHAEARAVLALRSALATEPPR